MSVITVENISKKYIISHQSKDSYGTLRDVIAEKFRNAGRRIFHPFNGSTVTHSHSSTTEEFWALKDVSFDIKQGDRVGIIGRNGAGKSTLLKILSRITEPTTGKIRIKGRVASLLEVGTGFHPELTGRENIFLNGAILGMTKAEITKKFDEIVAFSEIEKFLDTPVKRYSSGMYVRLAFAVAAHLEPEILIVDEVLAVGDAQFQKKCLGKMEEVGKEGRTVLFVSHNMGAISMLCSRVLYLENGSKKSDGNVEEGVNNYLKIGNLSKGFGCLENIKDRSGYSKFSRILSIQTLDENLEEADIFKMGSKIIIKITLKLIEYIKNLEIGFTILNSKGINYGGFVSNWEGLTSEFEEGIHTVICEVPFLYMMPGFYKIVPWCKKQGEGVDDQVNEAIEFEVVEFDITGHRPYFERYNHLGVFLRSNWSVENREGLINVKQ